MQTEEARSAADRPSLAELEAELAEHRKREEQLRVENEELREAQLLLEEAEANYAEIQALAPVPLITLARRGCWILSANRAACDLFGRERPRLVGESLLGLVRAEDRAKLQSFLSAQTGGARICDIELDPALGAGIRVRLRSTISPRKPDLLHLSILGAGRGGAEQSLNARLDAQARAQDRFIALLSYQLRTPLAPMLAVASSLTESQDLTPELRDSLQLIARNVHNEARLVDDLLDLSGLAQGRMRLELQRVDVHALLDECKSTLAAEALRKQVELVFAPEAESFQSEADPLRLRQVFANLIGNAIKFTPAGGDILIRTWNVGGALAVEVRDSGPGLRTNDLERLFEPFAQGEGQRRGGLGLGLAISKGIMELHGGTIKAASAGLGLGTSMLVELSTCEGSAARLAPPHTLPSAAMPAGRESGIARRFRVLVVEDHDDTLSAVRAVLEMHDYKVLTASTAKEAESLDLGEVDLVLCDEGLPDLRGTQLLPRLRSRHDVPAVVMSGFGMRQDIERYRAAGFDEHLLKPVDTAHLLQALERLLRSADHAHAANG